MPVQTTVHLIAAARPNFMKVAPLYHALRARSWCRPVLIHTGQHYDANMSDNFFKDLRLPPPDHHLEVGSGSHAQQTGGVMIAYERVLSDAKPACVVVVGDVNSTLACALVGAKLLVPVVHLEAGLRSGDRTMPEEINRLATDAISDVLWTPSPDADENLRREGVPDSRIERVGNIMIDSYEMLRDEIARASTTARLCREPGAFAVVTLHRPSNVDSRETLASLVAALIRVADRMPIVFPLHPRTRRQLDSFGLLGALAALERITLCEPLSYIEFMNVVSSAKCVITDSGGVQEETTYLGVPCLTLRESTERPITVTEGSNRLVTVPGLLDAVETVRAGRWPRGRAPDRWDGRTAERCADSIERRFARYG